MAAPLTENARIVLQRRYLRRDADGRVVESPEEMWRRVARAVAAAEERYGGAAAVRRAESRFEELLASLRFLPNSPCLMNAGTPLGQLAACFVVPVPDSIPEIFEAVRDMAIVHQTGGGVGFDFSRLRPAGAIVGSTGGEASGPVSFMQVFDKTTEVMLQGGRRRGANMGILRVDHPDAERFIAAKADPTLLKNFNLSVACPDDFMRAALEGGSYPVRDPRTGRPLGQLDAAALLERICEMAWRTGDPGLVFLDAINRANPTPELGPISCTNPCGEQPLLAYESCNLGSMNLLAYARASDLDWASLARDVREAVRFLDDVIDANRYPLPQIEAMTRGNRKVGLGVMGWHDLLVALGVPYDAPEALALAERVMACVTEEGRRASAALAAERGSFPTFRASIWPQRGFEALRNATVTTVAPTGTISLIASVSSGIEPHFALAYRRKALEGDELTVVAPQIEAIARARGFWSEELARRILAEGSVAALDEVPADAKRLFRTALEIDPEVHVRMQAAFQRHTDAAVSKTVNLREEATPADVKRIYRLAWELECKGITVFRSGSRAEQVLYRGAGLPEAPGQCRACAT